jgi:hypothetical protein
MEVWSPKPVLQEGHRLLNIGRIEDARRAAERAQARAPDDPAVLDFMRAVDAAEK